MLSLRRTRVLVVAACCVGGTGCVPYTVATTAQPVPLGNRDQSLIATVLSRGGESFGDSSRAPIRTYVSFDGEARFPTSEVSDVGIRFPSASGIVVNYKRLHGGFPNRDSAGVATMWGGGLINMGLHAHFEGTFLWSLRRRGYVTPYGGARLMQALPLSRRAAHDAPTAGAFLGFVIGHRDFAVVPEIGFYHDHSVLGLRPSPWMIIPSISIRNLRLPAFPAGLPGRPKP